MGRTAKVVRETGETSVTVELGLDGSGQHQIETGVVMLVYLDQAFREVRSGGTQRIGRHELGRAVIAGAVERVRPKMMTVMTTMVGLLPIMWGHGAGSQAMKRIAAPMVGGMVSSTVLTLVVIPAIYALWKEWELRGDGGRLDSG